MRIISDDQWKYAHDEAENALNDALALGESEKAANRVYWDAFETAVNYWEATHDDKGSGNNAEHIDSRDIAPN